MTIPILILGNSHTAAVVQAIGEYSDIKATHIKLSDPQFAPPFTASGGRTVFNPKLITAIRSALETPGATVAGFWGTNLHFELGIARLQRPFDFVLPSMPDAVLDPSSELIPFEMMRERFRDRAKMAFQLPAAIRAFHDGPMLAIAPPPPLPDGPFIRRKLIGSFRARVEATGLPSNALRMKLWRLAIETLREAAEECRSDFIHPPQAAVCGDGFLQEKAALDLLHGNSCYGRMVIEQIRERTGA